MTYTEFLNFLSGHAGLDSISFVLSTNGITISSSINIPLLETPLITMDKLASIPMTDFRQVPNVRLYVAGPPEAGNYWFETDSFPFSRDIIREKLYFHEQQKLFTQKPDLDEGFSNFIHDPEDPVFTVGGGNMITQTPMGDRRNQGQMNLADPLLAPLTMTRDDVLFFESNVLSDTFSIIGFPVANLFASSNPTENHSDLTSTDFFVRILDVYPDGAEYFVVEGAINARARDYAKQLATGEEDPNIPFTNIESDRIYEYNFKMMPIAYTFGRGHKIKVLISSSNHPRYQSNPNLPLEKNSFFRWQPGDELPSRKSMQTIYYSKEHPSSIELPVYKDQFKLPLSTPKNSAQTISQIRIFPNPANVFVYIESGGTDNTLEVFTLSGKKMMSANFNASHTINVESWNPGIYILRVTNATSEIFHSRKIIINQHL